MFEWSDLPGRRAARVVSERDPRTHPWGVFSRDAALAPMTSPGVFAWFATREEAGAFLGEVAPALVADPETWPAFERRQAATRHVVAMVEAGDAGTDEVMAELTHIWEGAASFEWWGRLEDLTTAEAPFPLFVRAHFHAGEGRDESRPIAPHEMEGFLGFLRTGGI